MYLCIGVLLDLVSKFKRGRAYDAPKSQKEKLISNEKICEYLFKTCLLPEEMYINPKISPIIKCKPGSRLKGSIINYFSSYNIYDEDDAFFLHNELASISNDILTKVLNPNYIKAFIESLMIVIKQDNSISPNTIIGMNPEYTRTNMLTWKAFDVKEFLLYILYFTYIRPDNEKGTLALAAFDDTFIKERINSLNFISMTDDNGTQRLTFKFWNANRNDETDVLSHELTNTMVIRSTAQNILFRETEYNRIIEDLQHKQLPNILLHGMGGCGKTSLARMVYCHLKDQYDCCGWINYSGDIRQSMIAAVNLEDYSDETMIENDIQKKWQLIKRKLINSTQSKLLVIDNIDNIDGIQAPRQDKELLAMSSWSNMTIILTSRLPDIPGYNNTYLIENLGNAESCENCIELFYHYNPTAAKQRPANVETVKKLCALAGYNTMVIELLAKGSVYHFYNLEKFYKQLLKNNFSCANDTPVETDHDYTIIKTKKSNENYYDIGNETVASQIYKLFNLKTRSPLQQLILWDFHCLRENEKVSLEELKHWMGFELKDIIPLVKEGWIKQLDDYFFIHPLVYQSVSCSKETSEAYWETKKSMMTEGTYFSELISCVLANTFFSKTDSFELSLRKLIFVDCLTYHMDYLTPFEWINIADFARKQGSVQLSIYYYKKAYDYYTSIPSNSNMAIDIAPYWRCTYFYGYMLSYTRAGFETAEELLKHSLNIAEKLVAEKGPTDDNMRILATSLDHLGYVLSNSLNNDITRITKADFYLNEAVKLRKLLYTAKPDHQRLMHDYAWSLDNLGAFYTNIDINKVVFSPTSSANNRKTLTKEEVIEKKEQTEGILIEALEIRTALANARLDNDSTEVAWTYFNLASLLYTTLAEPTNGDTTSCIIDYANTTTKQAKFQNAEKYLREALKIYHRLDEKFPGQHISSEARTLALYGRLLKICPKREYEAKELFEQAMNLYTFLDNEYPGRYAWEMTALKEEGIY